MPRYTLKLGDNEYLEWSTIVDAPVTYITDRDEMIAHLRFKYGDHIDITRHMNIVDEQGTSCRDGQTVEQIISSNRAGPNESHLTLAEIKQRYGELK